MTRPSHIFRAASFFSCIVCFRSEVVPGCAFFGRLLVLPARIIHDRVVLDCRTCTEIQRSELNKRGGYGNGVGWGRPAVPKHGGCPCMGMHALWCIITSLHYIRHGYMGVLLH